LVKERWPVTEAEWLARDSPWGMVEFLGDRSERKLKLFACACCRRVWRALTDARSRGAVEATERWLEGGASDAVLETAEAAARSACDASDRSPAAVAATYLPLHTGWKAAAHVAFYASTAHGHEVAQPDREAKPGEDALARAWDEEQAAQTDLVRDIFGNPFRPVPFDPSWRTDRTAGIAAKLYEDRDFTGVPVLADALEEAGCDNTDIIVHCRGPGPHVRGCWVVDLLLGKE
jgi:hypothetical protein